MTQTTEGTGPGSVQDIYPRIINGRIPVENIVGEVGGANLENSTEDITISTAAGTEGNVDAKDINITGGAGHTSPTGDNDGGSVFITGGQASGDGDGGNVEITGGATGDYENADAGDVIIRGGSAGVADNSDAGDVQIYGGDASMGLGDSDGGLIRLQAGDSAVNGEAGDVFIYAGNSGTGDGNPGIITIQAGNSASTADNINGGDVTLNAGSGANNGKGGDIVLNAGVSGTGSGNGGDITLSAGSASGAGDPGRVIIYSMPIMPVYANNSARDAAAGTPVNGMFCYNTTTGNIEVYVGGVWKSVNVSAIV